VNGHEKDSMQTYGAVTGTLNSAIALGSLIGPVFGGAITQVSDFTWTLTSLAGFSLPVVSLVSFHVHSMSVCDSLHPKHLHIVQMLTGKFGCTARNFYMLFGADVQVLLIINFYFLN